MFNFEDVSPDTGEAIESQETDEPVYEDEDFNAQEDQHFDYISELLKTKGIDRDKIQFYDENNTLSEVRFDDLTDEEKFDVLNTDVQTPQLSDAEIETLNFLRKNNMSLQDFANWQKKQAVDEYLSGQEPKSDTDAYSDEEMIAYDLIRRFGDDMTDEEIDSEIERLKENPDAFAKRVALLRNAYKSEAEAQVKLYEERKSQEAEALDRQFKDAYVNAAENLRDIQGISLDDTDRAELLDYVLKKDASGRTELIKALDNPENVLKISWFLRHGEEAFAQTVDYFKNEIAKREKPRPRAVARPRVQTKDRFSFT